MALLSSSPVPSTEKPTEVPPHATIRPGSLAPALYTSCPQMPNSHPPALPSQDPPQGTRSALACRKMRLRHTEEAGEGGSKAQISCSLKWGRPSAVARVLCQHKNVLTFQGSVRSWCWRDLLDQFLNSLKEAVLLSFVLHPAFKRIFFL